MSFFKKKYIFRPKDWLESWRRWPLFMSAYGACSPGRGLGGSCTGDPRLALRTPD